VTIPRDHFPEANADPLAVSKLYEDQFKELADHFDANAAVDQWRQFKYILMQPDYKIKNFKDDWSDLVDDGLKDAFSEVFKLASVSLILPLNTAIVERGFSKMNIIKSKLRNRLKVNTVTQ
jgi:hypothetical protein